MSRRCDTTAASLRGCGGCWEWKFIRTKPDFFSSSSTYSGGQSLEPNIHEKSELLENVGVIDVSTCADKFESFVDRFQKSANSECCICAMDELMKFFPVECSTIVSHLVATVHGSFVSRRTMICTFENDFFIGQRAVV